MLVDPFTELTIGCALYLSCALTPLGGLTGGLGFSGSSGNHGVRAKSMPGMGHQCILELQCANDLVELEIWRCKKVLLAGVRQKTKLTRSCRTQIRPSILTRDVNIFLFSFAAPVINVTDSASWVFNLW